MQLIASGAVSSPMLVNITSIENTIPKNRYVVYYQIPVFTGLYKSIQDIKELLFAAKSIRFKILDLEVPTSPPIIQEALINVDNTKVAIHLKSVEGEIKLGGKIINKANQNGVVFSLRVSDISGYLNFLKFREKYRTLENITRKQVFKLDHRLKVIDDNSAFYFSLQQSDSSRYFFTNRKLTVQVEQIYSIQDFKTVEILLEDTIDLSTVQSSMTAIIGIMQKLKIALAIEMIKNSNFAFNQIASLRVLEMSPACKKITIGTDKMGELATVEPLLNDRFYDYEFGYMSENLKQMENVDKYDYISKLTRSFPVYPHFKNSKIIDINGAKFLIVSFTNRKNKQQLIRFPFVYLLQGINIIQNETYTIKLYMEFSGEALQNVIQKPADNHRIFEFRLKDIWNLGQVCQKYKNFVIRMIAPGLNYYIPFMSAQVDSNSFKKQSKQLQLKSQYGQLNLNKYYLLTTGSQQNKLWLSKTESISQFYLMDLFNSSSITFQITSNNDIVLQGTILRQKIIKSGGLIKVILSSPDSFIKTVLIFQSSQIKQQNQSLRTQYSFMYRLQFTDDIPCNNIQYDLELKRLTDNKKYRTKISPEVSDDGVSTLHNVEAEFFESTEADMQLSLAIRKMYYNEETQYFDNGEAVSKKIYINPSPGHFLQKNSLFITIKKQGYSSVELDFYDENIKKRLRLHLEMCMRKLPLLDMDPGRYIIKIPQYLWKINRHEDSVDSITIETHLSSKRRKGQKVNIFPDSPQEYSLPHNNYKDGCSLLINGQIGYQKMIHAIKVRCDVTNKGIGWAEQSQWYLAIINAGQTAFHFLLKYSFDPNAEKDQRGESQQSQGSHKTLGRKKSERSYSDKIDPLAKTVSNIQLLKLKQHRNNLLDEGRKLTTNYMKKQAMIINLQRKIQDLDYKTQKIKTMHRQSNQSTTTETTNVTKKQKPNTQKMKSFYRSICQCGYKNPQFNGYCEQCLKKLKKRYQVFFKQFKQKSYEYERIYFNKFNAKQKYLKAKNKLRHYKARLKEGLDIDDNNINEVVKYLQEGDLKRQIQQSKIELFRLQQEREKLETSSKQRMDALQAMIRKEDEQIWSNTGEMERLNQQLRELDLKIDNSRPPQA